MKRFVFCLVWAALFFAVLQAKDLKLIMTGGSEVQYRLTGSTTDGSFKIYSVEKYGLTLDGVSIANSDGAAINSQCKKKMTLVLADGI